MRNQLKVLVAIAAITLIGLFAVACTESEAEGQRKAAVEDRAGGFSRAEAAVPIRPSVNFPLRGALEEFNFRLDQENTLWYVYVLGFNGNMLGYYTATTRPINSCNFLSSTEQVRTSSNGNLVLTAPSLDGIFYGGSGASGACQSHFFFDAATGAMIEIGSLPFWVSDQPLLLEAEPILVAPQ